MYFLFLYSEQGDVVMISMHQKYVMSVTQL